jgi:hypothetical protein
MRLLLSLGCALALSGCAIVVNPPGGGDMQFGYMGDVAKGNGQMGNERRAVIAATGIEVSGPVTVDVRVGPAPMIEVWGDSNLLPLLRTDMSGDTLRVWVNGNVAPQQEMRVRFTTPSLTRIQAAGAGRLTVMDLNGARLTVVKGGTQSMHLAGRVSNLDMQVDGSGNLNASALYSGNASVNMTGSGSVALGQIKGDALTVNVRGHGEFQANGVVQSVNAHVYGMGGANLVGLASQQATLSSHGAGEISASVNQSLIAQANGGGRITVFGNPTHRAVTGRNVYVLN